MNKKYLLLGLGTAAAVAAPIVSVVSCGSDDSKETVVDEKPTGTNSGGENVGPEDDLFGSMYEASEEDKALQTLLDKLQSWGVAEGESISSFNGKLLGYGADILTAMAEDGNDFTLEEFTTLVNLVFDTLPETVISSTTKGLVAIALPSMIPQIFAQMDTIKTVLNALDRDGDSHSAGDVVNAYLGNIPSEDSSGPMSMMAYILQTLDYGELIEQLPTIVQNPLLDAFGPVLGFLGGTGAMVQSVITIAKDVEISNGIKELIDNNKGTQSTNDFIDGVIANPASLLDHFDTLELTLHTNIQPASLLKAVDLVKTMTVDDQGQPTLPAAVLGLLPTTEAEAEEFLALIQAPTGQDSVLQKLLNVIVGFYNNGIIPTLSDETNYEFFNALKDTALLDKLYALIPGGIADETKSLVNGIFDNAIISGVLTNGLKATIADAGVRGVVDTYVGYKLPTYSDVIMGLIDGFGPSVQNFKDALESLSAGITTSTVAGLDMGQILEGVFNTGSLSVGPVDITIANLDKLLQNGLLSLTEAEITALVGSLDQLGDLTGFLSTMGDAVPGSLINILGYITQLTSNENADQVGHALFQLFNSPFGSFDENTWKGLTVLLELFSPSLSQIQDAHTIVSNLFTNGLSTVDTNSVMLINILANEFGLDTSTVLGYLKTFGLLTDDQISEIQKQTTALDILGAIDTELTATLLTPEWETNIDADVYSIEIEKNVAKYVQEHDLTDDQINELVTILKSSSYSTNSFAHLIATSLESKDSTTWKALGVNNQALDKLLSAINDIAINHPTEIAGSTPLEAMTSVVAYLLNNNIMTQDEINTFIPLLANEYTSQDQLKLMLAELTNVDIDAILNPPVPTAPASATANGQLSDADLITKWAPILMGNALGSILQQTVQTATDSTMLISMIVAGMQWDENMFTEYKRAVPLIIAGALSDPSTEQGGQMLDATLSPTLTVSWADIQTWITANIAP